jgi:hypothetical protein
MTPEPPNTSGLQPHARTAALADWVREVVEGQVPAMSKTPPRAVFRNNLAGRKAWLAAAERTLKFGP